jgi:hypothetical protein
VEVDAEGHVRLGEYLRDAGSPFVAGRWGLGWTASRIGYETTDGGMTWTKNVDLPEPIAPAPGVRERACGPVGCLAGGWLRVGWGKEEEALPQEPPLHSTMAHTPPPLDLECEALSGRAPEPKAAAAPPASSRPPPLVLQPFPIRSLGGGLYGGAAYGTVNDFASYPFAGRAGPAMPGDDVGMAPEVATGLEHALRGVPLARAYAWGPKSGDWDALGRWQVRWQSPWVGWPEARSSAVAPTPWTTLDAAARALLARSPGTASWALAAGDDADHALLVAHHNPAGSFSEVFVLEADRAPFEVRRTGGDALPDVEGAARIGGRWYLATTQGPGELAATVVYALDGAVAHELARVPRAGYEGRPTLRLARHTDGRSLGLVVDGQADTERGVAWRWVVGIDLASGAAGDPEPLAPVDLSDRPVALCTGDDTGWQVELPYSGSVRVRVPPAFESSVQSTIVRVRLSRERACVERLLGSIDSGASSAPEALVAASPYRARSASQANESGRTIDASIFSARMRYALRCGLTARVTR